MQKAAYNIENRMALFVLEDPNYKRIYVKLQKLKDSGELHSYNVYPIDSSNFYNVGRLFVHLAQVYAPNTCNDQSTLEQVFARYQSSIERQQAAQAQAQINGVVASLQQPIAVATATPATAQVNQQSATAAGQTVAPATNIPSIILN